MKKTVQLTAILVVTLTAAITANAEDIQVKEADYHAVVGAGIFYGPEYLGASKNRLGPAIYGEIQDKSGLFAGTARGIGIEKKLNDFSLSTSIGYRPGRLDSRDSKSIFSSDALKGMGSIPGALIGNVGASVLLGSKVKATMNASLALSHRETGNAIEFGLSTPIFQIPGNHVDIAATASYGDAKYNQTNFGVTATQSENSGYASYNASAGFSGANLMTSWTHEIDKNWSVRGSVGMMQMLGSAANSPLTKKKTNQILMATVNYTF